jgi:hypothetical protein
MTNGGGPHGRKRSKKTGAKPAKGKGVKASLQRKGWLPSKSSGAKGE